MIQPFFGEGVDYVTCQVCRKQFQQISWTHLKHKHNTTTKKYKKQFPKAFVVSKKRSEQCRQAFLGGQHTKETKQKIGEFHKGIPRTKETKRKISESHKGLKHTEKTKKKLSLITKKWFTSHKHSMLGKPLSTETKAKMSEAIKLWYSTHEHPRLGKTHTDEAKQKISEAHKGRKQTPESIQKRALANTGKKRTEETKVKIGRANSNPSKETRRRMSKAQKGRIVSEETRKKMSETRSGSKSHNWRGGNSSEYAVGWRAIAKEIRERDNNKCLLCGTSWDGIEKQFNVHHIDMMKKNNKPNNLATVCAHCHMSKIHTTPDSESQYEISLSLLLRDMYGYII